MTRSLNVWKEDKSLFLILFFSLSLLPAGWCKWPCVVYLSLLCHSISHTLGYRVFEHGLCLPCGNRILVKPEAQSQHSFITVLFPFLSQASLHDQKHPRCVPVPSSPLPVLPPWPISVCSVSGLFSALWMQGQPGSLGSTEVEGPRWPSGTLDIHLPPAGSVT